MKRLAGQDTDMTPVGSTTAYGMVELMKLCEAERPLADTDPAAMAKLSLAGYQYAGFEWVKAMGWDITSISQALGCGLGEPAMDMPLYVKTHPFSENPEALECPENLLELGRFPVFKEQFRILKNELGDQAVIFGMSEGPFTCAANLVGTSLLMKMTLKEPDRVRRILEATIEAVVRAANFAFAHGADYYCLAEPTSGPELMSPRSWEALALPTMEAVVKQVSGPVVLHICGNTDKLIPLMCRTGVAGISIEEKADLKQAVAVAHQSGVKVFGNVSSATTLFRGTTEACYAEARRSLEDGVDFLAPGCGIAPLSPLENVRQLRRARDDYFA
jgi:[methyl-Co(III) methanol-specific corrinoid protein]:coenzyme M methyltransferase